MTESERLTKELREKIADFVGVIYCSQCPMKQPDYDCEVCDKVHLTNRNQATLIINSVLIPAGVVFRSDEHRKGLSGVIPLSEVGK